MSTIPTVKLADGQTVPDVLALRATGLSWAKVAEAAKLKNASRAEALGWRVRFAKSPELAIPATPDGIREARDVQKLRWEEIAIRAGLKGPGTARALYAEATGIIPETTFVGSGRHYAEARDGAAKPAPAVARKLATIKKVRKTTNVRGDANVLARAKEELAS